jgi:predicted RNA binding protein YcfA (HicA-like mRNA interferase family)
MKVRDIIKMVQKDGWYHVRTPAVIDTLSTMPRGAFVTIPGHPGDDVATGTLNSIKKQAGLK